MNYGACAVGSNVKDYPCSTTERMKSLMHTLLIGGFLCMQQLAFSGSIPTSQASLDEMACGNWTSVLKGRIQSCLRENLTPNFNVHKKYWEFRCPICAHFCSKKEIVLECLNNVIEASAPCNNRIRNLDPTFLPSILLSTVTFFCEDGGVRISPLVNGNFRRCILNKEGNCGGNFIHDLVTQENNVDSEDSSSSAPEDMAEELKCRRYLEAVKCGSKKAASCNEETGNVLKSFAAHLEKSSPCSIFYNKS